MSAASFPLTKRANEQPTSQTIVFALPKSEEFRSRLGVGEVLPGATTVGKTEIKLFIIAIFVPTGEAEGLMTKIRWGKLGEGQPRKAIGLFCNRWIATDLRTRRVVKLRAVCPTER